MTVLDKPLALVPVDERSETESESADESVARPETPVRGAMPIAALVARADAAQRPADRDVLDYDSVTDSESSEDDVSDPPPTPAPQKRSRPEAFTEDRETRRDRRELQQNLTRILYRTERVYKALRPIVRESTRADLLWLIDHTKHGIEVASSPQEYAASATAQAMRGLRD